jgi:hypothetical protein
MALWLERGESQFLDLITVANFGLVDTFINTGKAVDKYTLIKNGIMNAPFWFLSNFSNDTKKDIFTELRQKAQGRYIREFAYDLVSLFLAIDTSSNKLSKIKIDSIKDFFTNYRQIVNLIQDPTTSYLPTNVGKKLVSYDYATKKWLELIRQQVLSYGYFCRFLDSIKFIQDIKNKSNIDGNKVFFSELKNIIGPFDVIVARGGPDFIQTAFKVWGYYLDIFDYNERILDENTKLLQLRTDIGYFGGKPYFRRIKNLRRALFEIKKCCIKPIRIPNFLRLVNLNLWRKNFRKALMTSLFKVAIIYFLDRNINKKIHINELLENEELIKLTSQLKIDIKLTDIIDILLYIEATGLLLKVEISSNFYTSLTSYLLELLLKQDIKVFDKLKIVNRKNLFYSLVKPILQKEKLWKDITIENTRNIDKEEFELYIPRGDVFLWLKNV